MFANMWCFLCTCKLFCDFFLFHGEFFWGFVGVVGAIVGVLGRFLRSILGGS